MFLISLPNPRRAHAPRVVHNREMYSAHMVEQVIMPPYRKVRGKDKDSKFHNHPTTTFCTNLL